MPSKLSLPIPVLLLKTCSQPHDTYEEYFINLQAYSTSNTDNSLPQFRPSFVPVLEHKQNEKTLQELGQLLKTGELKQRYGGMIFTSQRAVEAWSDTVLAIAGDETSGGRTVDDRDRDVNNLTGTKDFQQSNTATDTRTGHTFETDILTSTPFPLYVVGPATGRALDTLVSTLDLRQSGDSTSSFLALNPSTHGASTGSGAALAPFILNHYNTLHSQKWFIFHDAPRLPFIPLLGMGSENYSRRRLEPDDARLIKRPLLFLVGEQRRDIIPKTLMDERLGRDAIQVDEVEVYSTVVKSGFQDDFGKHVITAAITRATDTDTDTSLLNLLVIIVFSPQGSGEMLRGLGLIDEKNQLTEKTKTRWDSAAATKQKEPILIIATIGPTTRDHLIDTFGFLPDVCANKPSPEGIGEGILLFLKEKSLL